MRIGPLSVEVVYPGQGGVASLAALRRRPCLRALPVGRRAIIVGWLRL